MTHVDFVWKPNQWTYDYVAHFERFKQVLCDAVELYFPDYTLQWVIRCDASQYAVGCILFQIVKKENGEEEHQLIACASKRFSKPAQNWDAFKREAFALYFAVFVFAYYMRGKEFVIETDHRNLQ